MAKLPALQQLYYLNSSMSSNYKFHDQERPYFATGAAASLAQRNSWYSMVKLSALTQLY
ncbi:hypothetical protein HDF23_004845 [Mucilaginibacter lappiensis]|uniref:Uncharacterized protein n=1 Tax=Mucilaginibacter lappiensis TaxID=354630 RepID=A0ABR6PQL1_9SPHI|nr:hypothetical protein [Mucilaginibacter lappiensis]MBB6112072.1 hypothetical protein [Mucilaginibacter lappiensis]